MSKPKWQAFVGKQLDEKLRRIKEKEGYESRSKTAEKMISKGVRQYETTVLHSLLEKGALIGAIGAVMAAILFVANAPSPRLLRIAVLLGVTSIAFGAGSAFDLGIKSLPQVPPARADGGEKKGGDDQ